jgi:hypothetical protein
LSQITFLLKSSDTHFFNSIPAIAAAQSSHILFAAKSKVTHSSSFKNDIILAQ